jgi:tetratricopeptide (TPR) repeat protein
MYNIFLNPSIAAILFGIAAIFLFTLLKKTHNRLAVICTILLFLLCVSCTIYLNSRIVWLSMLLVLVITTLTQQKIKLSKAYKFITIICFLIVLWIIGLHKQKSSHGRLFIYKINAQILQEHWLTGINQPYSVVFNHTQASYFANNAQATLEEKLLAGNNYFVLNEWLNILIHYGILVFIFTVLATIYLIKICFKQLKLFPKKAWAVGIVLFLLMVSLVSYPFSFTPYLFIFGACALYVLKDSFNLSKRVNNTIFCTLFIGLFVFCLNNTYITIKEEKEKKAITDLFRVGYINQALTKALDIQHTQPPTHQVYEQIAAIYLQKNNIDSAIFYIDLAHNFICNDELHNFWGNCLLQQNKFKEAINQFTLAVNIIPHRFKNRFDLLNAYLIVSDFEQAKKCGNEIISLPEKIPSKKSAFYKQQTLAILDTLSR